MQYHNSKVYTTLESRIIVPNRGCLHLRLLAFSSCNVPGTLWNLQFISPILPPCSLDTFWICDVVTTSDLRTSDFRTSDFRTSDFRTSYCPQNLMRYWRQQSRHHQPPQTTTHNTFITITTHVLLSVLNLHDEIFGRKLSFLPWKSWWPDWVLTVDGMSDSLNYLTHALNMGLGVPTLYIHKCGIRGQCLRSRWKDWTLKFGTCLDWFGINWDTEWSIWNLWALNCPSVDTHHFSSSCLKTPSINSLFAMRFREAQHSFHNFSIRQTGLKWIIWTLSLAIRLDHHNACIFSLNLCSCMSDCTGNFDEKCNPPISWGWYIDYRSRSANQW